MAEKLFHLLRETPDNSGIYLETGETVTTDETEAKNRCRALSGETGSRHGIVVGAAEAIDC